MSAGEGKAAILSAVRDAGVVGAGGAGFPTHVKLAAAADVVLVNGAECEPLLRVDQTLCDTQPDLVIDGLLAAMSALGANVGVIGLKAKYHGAIEATNRILAERGLRESVSVGLLPDVYPAGDEHVLVYELTGRVVPQGALPLAVGAAVANVETLLNVAGALKGQPVTHTWLTVGGAVARPFTARVPIGVPMRDVVALAGQPAVPDCALIEGGPMMGRVVSNAGEPVTKLTKGLLLLPLSSPVVDEKVRPLVQGLRRTASACDQCRNCTDLCPRYLLGHDLRPHVVLRAVNNGLPVEPLITQASLCCECGLCSLIACPVNLWPRRVNATLRAEFRRQAYPKRMPSNPIAAPRPERSGRMIPTKRLASMLGLAEWNVAAPLLDGSAFDGTLQVVIPLRQHAGAPAKATVAVGDVVSAGQPIGEPAGEVSSAVHASIGGVVTSVGAAVTITRGGERG